MTAAGVFSAWLITVANIPNDFNQAVAPFVDKPFLLLIVINKAVFKCAIDLLTLPVGVVLNVACGVGKIGMEDIIKGIYPILIVEIIVRFF